MTRSRATSWAGTVAGVGGLWLASAGCADHHAVPAQPTWSDVEPIVRGSCTQCHGSNASVAGSSYRFDFYDMPAAVCGEAATALGLEPTLGGGLATLIGTDVTSPGGGWRSRMPPAPGAELADWERLTIQRWAKNPSRGLPPPGDRRPEIRISSSSAVGDKSLSLTVMVSDADGEPVVGVLKIGEKTLFMDRPGAFSGTVDTATWPNGIYPVTAVLCDGWDNVTYDLGNAQIKHAQPLPALPDGGTDAADALSDAAAAASDKPVMEASAAAHE
jgi:hypothetical protein